MEEWYFWLCALAFSVPRFILETGVLSGVLPGAVVIQLQVEQTGSRAALLPPAKCWWSAVSQTQLGSQPRLTPNLYSQRCESKGSRKTGALISGGGMFLLWEAVFLMITSWQGGRHTTQWKSQTLAKAAFMKGGFSLAPVSPPAQKEQGCLSCQVGRLFLL